MSLVDWIKPIRTNKKVEYRVIHSSFKLKITLTSKPTLPLVSKTDYDISLQGCGSGSGWIRNHLGLWIRIHIPISDPRV